MSLQSYCVKWLHDSAYHKLWISGDVASEEAFILASRNCDYSHEEGYPLSLPISVNTLLLTVNRLLQRSIQLLDHLPQSYWSL